MKNFTMRAGDGDILDVEREGDILKITITERTTNPIDMTAEINYSDFIKLLALLEK